MPDIENLSIQITSNVSQANAALDGLSKRLDTLASALGRIDTSRLSGLGKTATAVKSFGDSLKSVETANISAIGKLSANLSKISDMKVAGLDAVPGALRKLTEELNRLDKLSGNAVKVGEFANAISRLRGSGIKSVTAELPKLTTELNNLLTTLSKAPAVSSNVTQLLNSISRLQSTGGKVDSVSRQTSSGLGICSNSARQSSLSSFSLAAALGKVYAAYWALSRAAGVFKSSIDLSSALTEVQNVVDTAFGGYADTIQTLSDSAIQNYGMSELAFKQTASRFQAMGSAMGINSAAVNEASQNVHKLGIDYGVATGNMGDMAATLTQLSADIGSFFDMDQAQVAQKLESIYTGQTRPLRELGIDLTQVNLQQWALNQGMNVNVATMSQAQKAVLRYQYTLWAARNAMGDFQKTANTWANQVRILREQFKKLGTIIGRGLRRCTKGYYIKQPNMDCQPTEFTALSRHRAVFSWAGKGGIPICGA